MKWRLEFLKRLSSIDLFYASEFEIVDLIMILKKIFQFFKNAAPHFWIVAQDDGGEEAVGQQRHGHAAQVHQLPTGAVVHVLGRILQVLVKRLWKIQPKLVRNVRYSRRGWNIFTSTFSDIDLLGPRQSFFSFFCPREHNKDFCFVFYPSALTPNNFRSAGSQFFPITFNPKREETFRTVFYLCNWQL